MSIDFFFSCVSLYISRSLRACVCVSLCISPSLSLCLSLSLSLCRSIYLSLSLCISIYLSLSLSLSIYLSLALSLVHIHSLRFCSMGIAKKEVRHLGGRHCGLPPCGVQGALHLPDHMGRNGRRRHNAAFAAWRWSSLRPGRPAPQPL